jgi:plastocyanin
VSARPTSRRTLLLVLLAALATPAAALADTKVSITDTSFDPATVTVKRGEVVTWVNDGTKPHTVTSDDGTTMKSGPLDPGASFATLFKTVGTFRYRSTASGDTMQGTVVVKPGKLPTATGPTPPTGTVPSGFKPGTTTDTVTTTEQAAQSGSGTNWGTIGLVVAAAVVAAAAVLAVLLMRRRRTGGL